MPSPITEKLYEHYAKLLRDTERMVFSIMLSEKAKVKDLKDLNLLDLIRTIQQTNLTNVSFDEGELIVGEHYEIHSVCEIGRAHV